MTFVSCPQAVVAVGARPVFCDVTDDTVAIDIDHVARLITPRTRAVMPVHYAGFPCELDDLANLARNTASPSSKTPRMRSAPPMATE